METIIPNFFDISKMLEAERMGQLDAYLENELERIKAYDEQRAATANQRFEEYRSMVVQNGSLELIEYVKNNAEKIRQSFGSSWADSLKSAQQRHEERQKAAAGRLDISAELIERDIWP